MQALHDLFMNFSDHQGLLLIACSVIGAIALLVSLFARLTQRGQGAVLIIGTVVALTLPYAPLQFSGRTAVSFVTIRSPAALSINNQ